MILPTEKKLAVKSFEKTKTLIYGEPKIGKSTFCAEFPDALFLATENGLNHLETYNVPIKTFEEIEEACSLIIKDNRFQTVIIDTVDNLFQIVRRKALDKMGIETEMDASENKCGSVYKPINDLFFYILSLFEKINEEGKGVVFVSHSKLDLKGKTVCSMPEKPQKLLNAFVDNILYFGNFMADDGKEYRCIYTAPTTEYMAGCRTAKGIKLPAKTKLDYNNFISYFKGDK